jgi:non-heme chloroperoxidase
VSHLAQTEDGTRIDFETCGSGPLALLLLHGWGGSASYWRKMVSHLNVAGSRVIAPSYRGHGDSDKPATGYALDQMANDVLDVADAAGAQRFVLVGSARVESLHNMLPFTQSVYLGWC